MLLSVLLGVTPEDASRNLPSDLLAAMADLRTSLDECQKALK
jgi:hypothetical protein